MKYLSLSKSKTLFILVILWSCASAAQGFLYTELKMKDYDEMETMVKKHLAKAQSLEENDLDKAKIELELALLEIFSRPNSDDNLVSKLLPIVRTPLRNLEIYEKTVANVVNRAIHSAQNQKSDAKIGATSLVVLHNFMSEFRPDVKKIPEIRKIFIAIKDAKITPSKKVRTELSMRSMNKSLLQPSTQAKNILNAEK